MLVLVVDLVAALVVVVDFVVDFCRPLGSRNELRAGNLAPRSVVDSD